MCANIAFLCTARLSTDVRKTLTRAAHAAQDSVTKTIIQVYFFLKMLCYPRFLSREKGSWCCRYDPEGLLSFSSRRTPTSPAACQAARFKYGSEASWSCCCPASFLTFFTNFDPRYAVRPRYLPLQRNRFSQSGPQPDIRLGYGVRRSVWQRHRL